MAIKIVILAGIMAAFAALLVTLFIRDVRKMKDPKSRRNRK